MATSRPAQRAKYHAEESKGRSLPCLTLKEGKEEVVQFVAWLQSYRPLL